VLGRVGLAGLVVALLLQLGACSVLVTQAPVPEGALLATPWEQAAPGAKPAVSGPSSWTHQVFPGKKANRYQYVRLDGRPAMAVTSQAAASALRLVVNREPAAMDQLRFSWKVAGLIPDADLNRREKSDSPVRLVLTFDGDRSRLSARDAMLSELARAVTGEEMPYATLMYVWSNDLVPGTVVANRRTDRIRKLVIESGPAGLNQWQEYQRDIRADFEKVFGELPGTLMSVGIMTDTDNTGGQARAWYGPVTLAPNAQTQTLALPLPLPK
jgi:hypothetical protein